MSFVETDDNKRCNETKLETIETVSQEESVDPRVQVSATLKKSISVCYLYLGEYFPTISALFLYVC